jgi:DNA adenine methylase
MVKLEEEMSKRLKTPLRWCGGKSRALKKLDSYIPKNMNNIMEIRDPFLGGGSFPLYLSKIYPDKKIWVNDLYEPLYNYWICLRDNCEELVDILLKKKQEADTEEKSRLLFKLSKNIMNNKDYTSLIRAVAFYIVNKCSFSGLTEKGSFSKGSSVSNFKESIIKNQKYYSPIIQNWKITNSDYKECMEGDGHTFIYLDPPYDIKSNVYSNHSHFNHNEFKLWSQKCKCRILISYNKKIDNLDNFSFELTYTMKSDKKYIENQKKRNEMAITNYFDYEDTDDEESCGYLRGEHSLM